MSWGRGKSRGGGITGGGWRGGRGGGGWGRGKGAGGGGRFWGGCGMAGLSGERILEKAKARGVSEQILRTLENAGIDMHRWLRGFNDVREAVTKSVEVIRNHPLLPSDVRVHGLVMDPDTGGLEV